MLSAFLLLSVCSSWAFPTKYYSHIRLLIPTSSPHGLLSVSATVDENTARTTPWTGKEDDPFLKLPPGRPTPRFLGVLFDDTFKLLNPKSMAAYQLKQKKKFGPVFKTNIFFQPTVFCTDVASLKELASQEQKHLKAFFPPHHRKLFGKNALLVQSGDVHKRLRRLIQPSLSPVALKLYQDDVDKAIGEFLQELQADEQDYVALVPKIRPFFIKLLLRIVLGSSSKDGDLLESLADDLFVWSKGLVAPPLTFIPWSTAAKAMRARKRVVRQLLDIMEKSPGNGLLRELIEASSEEDGTLTPQQVIDNALLLVFAGSDTTASTAVSIWKTLLLQPELAKQLLENKKGVNDALVEAFVSKMLQAYPAAPFTMRQQAKTDDVIVLGDYKVPSNYLVVYGIAGAAQEEEKPQDISLDSTSDATADTVVSFGVGPRQCPGRFLANMELKSLVKQLVPVIGKFELKDDQKLEQQYTPGFFPVDGLLVKFTG